MKLLDKLLRVDELTQENVMRVFDVAFDIHEQLNIGQSKTVRIAATPQAVKFRQLLPYSTPPALDDYESRRRQACVFLKEIGIIDTYRAINEHEQRTRRQIEVTVTNDAELDEILDRLRTRLASQADHGTKSTAEIRYDAENGTLRYGDKKLTIKDGTLQHFVCKQTFENFGKKVTYLDIVEEWGRDESSQSVYDACRLLNEKVKKNFGLEPLFTCSGEKVWLNTL